MTDNAAPDGDLSALAGEPALVHRVFDQMPLIVGVLEGPQLRVMAATGLYRAWTGRADVVGKLIHETFSEVIGQQLFQSFQRVYDGHGPELLRDFRLQLDLPDTGEQAEFFVDASITPLLGSDGEVTGVIVSVADVTERVRERQAAQQRANVAERRYEQARDVIDTLQRELLPSGVPVLPRVQVAASYLLANAEDAAGGDWFDSQALPDGRVALVVGDVVGHGVTASATMGQLRTLLHERLFTDGEVATALAGLDAAADRIRGARAATVCVVLLDPATGALEYCTAGHPPPLVLSPTGERRYLPATGAGPIGVGGEFTAGTVGKDRLAEGEMILLYTDGILERPGRDLPQSTVELAQAAADVAADRALRDDAASPADRVCTQTLELLVRITGHTDDITLLAGQLVAPAPDRAWDHPATAASLGSFHQQLEEWLGAARVDGRDADALRHAAVELATNAIEHAYIDSADDHSFTVTAALTGTGQARLRVIDRGRWRPPAPSADRGLGLLIAEQLVDDLRVEHDDTGTTATLSLRLSHPARLLNADELAWTAATRPPVRREPLLVLDEPWAPGPRIRVDGGVDAATAGEFDRGVRTAGSTGARSLTVDLTGVTHLASAGVSALHRLRALHRDNGTELRLYAPAGTNADLIMTLVSLDHDTIDPDTAGA
ncbi:SpoIIE family protein phosphatase [Amycolatopsis sp., V23-08]|uniref:SpoIIE family protein phosphatase n=1 Tax=Amycolatopsis heterodermiae TaxID=3110235 RepID=A0ABU5R458_9PSEU|nr:SpoIIE family protein phosphatase [Amycolatopsis sp., V23-08]MEA5361003.1 SpoIIE family protein phosphatase [Amycolatopsis sp., V23-08]